MRASVRVCQRVCQHCVWCSAHRCHAAVLSACVMCSSLILGHAPSLPRLTISYGKTNEFR